MKIRKLYSSLTVLLAFIFVFMVGFPTQTEALAASNLDSDKSYQGDEPKPDWRENYTHGWVDVHITQSALGYDGVNWYQYYVDPGHAMGTLYIRPSGLIRGEVYGFGTSYATFGFGGGFTTYCIFLIGWEFVGYIYENGKMSIEVEEQLLPGFCEVCVLGICEVGPYVPEKVKRAYTSKIIVGKDVVSKHPFKGPTLEGTTFITYDYVAWKTPSGGRLSYGFLFP